jgi:hypothetical protein
VNDVNALELLHSATEEDLRQLEADIEALRAMHVAISCRLYGFKTQATMKQEAQSAVQPPVKEEPVSETDELRQKRRNKLRNHLGKEGPTSRLAAAALLAVSEDELSNVLKSVWFETVVGIVNLTDRGKNSYDVYRNGLAHLQNRAEKNGTASTA